MMYAQSGRASCCMLGGRRSGQNQALEQTRDSVLRYGERGGREMLNFFVMPSTLLKKEST